MKNDIRNLLQTPPAATPPRGDAPAIERGPRRHAHAGDTPSTAERDAAYVQDKTPVTERPFG